jgi:hypothetical protein
MRVSVFSFVNGLFVFLFFLTSQHLVFPQVPLPPPVTPPPSTTPVPPPGQTKPVLRDLSTISIVRLFYYDEQLRTRFSVSQEQIDKLEQLFGELDKELQELREKSTEIQLKRELLENQQKKVIELQKKLSDGFAKILSPEQLKSFNIVRFQIIGGFVSPMANAELLQIFDLSKEQTEQIDVLVKERQEKIVAAAAILREPPESQEQARERMMQVRQQGINISKEYGKKIRDLLNQEQQLQANQWFKESLELRELLKPYLPVPPSPAPSSPSTPLPASPPATPMPNRTQF